MVFIDPARPPVRPLPPAVPVPLVPKNFFRLGGEGFDFPSLQNNKNRSGLGLGLNIVRRAIDLSQGEVIVRNNAGKGRTFVVEIPKIITPGLARRFVISAIEEKKK